MSQFDNYDKLVSLYENDQDRYLDIALETVRLAVERTPVNTGRLADSYSIDIYGNLPHQVRVVNDCEYALYVHEMMENHHPNGGQAKFLEDAGAEIEQAYDVKTYIKLSRDEIALYFDEPIGTPVTNAYEDDDNYIQLSEFGIDVYDRKQFEEYKSDDDKVETFNSYLNYNRDTGYLDLYDNKLDFTPIEFNTNTHRFKNDNFAGQGSYKIKTIGKNKKIRIKDWEGIE